ncbi:P-loop containing nucleoside triphosphate hydrolase protein, partial [Zopfochytrium polystomum]
ASLYSRLSFSWFSSVMDHGYKNEITLADLWSVNPAENIDSNLQRYYRLRSRHPDASLLYVLYLFNRKTIITQAFLLAGSTAVFFAQPFFLNRILDFLDHRGEQGAAPVWVAYAFVVGMLLTTVIRYALDGQVKLLEKKFGIRNANILSGLIYRKALHRSPQIALEGDERGASVGKIANLMSVDSNSVGQWVGKIYFPIVTFVQIVLAVAALVYVLGVAALAGVTVLVVLIFSGTPLAGMLRDLWATLKVVTDRRVNAMNEFLQGIKIIKLFAWEKQFEEKINVLREDELKYIFEEKVVAAMNRVLWFSAPLLTTFVTLLTYTVVMGNKLDATVAFTALSLFNLLRGPLQTFPDTLVQLINTWVSYKRIDLFLKEEDLEEFTNPASNKASDSSPSTALGFENASFECLTELDGDFPVSKLTVIVGATGAGKSSLLLALLGEMRRTHGRRSCPVDTSTPLAAASVPSFETSLGVAYVPQVPWLLNATVRDNVLFGKPYDRVRYQRVIDACALVKDLETLDGGDMTEIGEKGINLSGGQKQRISLARAAYSDSPWVLLDDPLSAVDAPTARHIYEHCILDLLATRTRLLVTNAVGLAVPRADYLVLVESGRVVSKGAVEDVLARLAATAAHGSLTVDAASLPADGQLDDGATALGGLSPTDMDRKKKAKLVEDEAMATGNVKLSVYYLFYFALGGLPSLSILIAAYAVNVGLTVYMDVIVAQWTRSYEKADPTSSSAAVSVDLHQETFAQEENPTSYYLKYYAAFAVLTIATIIIRLVVLALVQQRAGRTIHRGMMRNVLGAPLRFFEVTPLGRIINRFSRDIEAVDFDVGIRFLTELCHCSSLEILTLLFVVGAITSVVPPLLFLLLPLGYVYARIGMYYIRTSRSLKRINSVTRSPIYSHFGETLTGVSVIRAFHRTNAFAAESCRRFDDSNRASYYLAISSIWASIRMQILSALVMFAASILILISGVDASVAGLCLNLTLQLSQALIILVWNQSWLEMSMNSVERCDEYLNLEQEAPAVIAGSRPPKDWPQEGRISIQNLEMRYSNDTPLVLHGISADIFPREKVGIVGRTGAGKSTLTLALLRIIEPAGGRLIIDGVDIRTLGLYDLRSNLTIIPQDPVLFAGTVRSNLDPFDSLDDATLWNALRRVHLVGNSNDAAHATATSVAAPDSASEPPSSGADTVSVESGGSDGSNDASAAKTRSPRHRFRITLDTAIAEGGSNLSAGQRQLLCLARALARTSKVIVLDEATASVDTETDSRIQDTIRTELSNSTVLTIAHRLKTIVDYDRVIVLDQGRIIENDTPYRLIRQSKVAVFRKMCEETGEFEELVQIAQEAEAKRRRPYVGAP